MDISVILFRKSELVSEVIMVLWKQFTRSWGSSLPNPVLRAYLMKFCFNIQPSFSASAFASFSISASTVYRSIMLFYVSLQHEFFLYNPILIFFIVN